MMLEVAGLDAFYGQNQALYGIDFALDEGQIRTLLGANLSQLRWAVQVLIGLMQARTNSSLLHLSLSRKDTIQNALAAAIVYLPQTYCGGEAYLWGTVFESCFQVWNEYLSLAGAHCCHGRETQIAIGIVCCIAQ